MVLLRQSGHGEKAVALLQALLEINLCKPDIAGPGDYDFDDKVGVTLSLLNLESFSPDQCP